VTEIVMDEMVMLDSRGASASSAASDSGNAPPQEEPSGKVDDLPF
jgi:hypothetical protein